MTKARTTTVAIDRGEIDLDDVEDFETVAIEMTAPPSLPRRIDTSSLNPLLVAVKLEAGVGSQSRAVGAAPLVAGTTPSKEEQARTKKMKERCNECMKNASKVHGEWDRRKREFAVTHAKSQKNRNTSGSPVETQLAVLLSECEKLDGSIMGLVNQQMHDGELDADGLDTMIGDSEQLSSHIKEASKKQAALSSWFRL